MELTPDILKALGAPFNSEELEAKPQTVSGAKALAVFYIDARIVMRRLDEICPGHWSFDFEPLTPDGKMVKGKLTVCGVTRCDAGQETQTDDKTLKSAVSDALKRAAVHFGVGRYIYHLPLIWADFDPQKKQFKQPPQISDAALQRALRLAGVIDAAPLRSQATQQRQQQQPRNIHQEAESAMRGQEKPAASMVANGGPGAPPATPSLAGMEPQAPRQSIWTAAASTRAASQGPPESSGDAASEVARCEWDGCGKTLTSGQRTISENKCGGRHICPAHQSAFVADQRAA